MPKIDHDDNSTTCMWKETQRTGGHDSWLNWFWKIAPCSESQHKLGWPLKICIPLIGMHQYHFFRTD